MLARADPGPLRLTFDGRPIAAREGDSVASALLAAGIQVTRRTPRGGVARGPYCMMGACFECLAEVDGVSNVQTCMTPVRDGMVVASQDGARTLGGAAGGDGERDGAAAGP
ncbi:MAG: (2Fe-2S)-binding protein [Rhodospirillales bacterium]|nr:(2Fe-2S)-binding protein [Rhodospirillales bacterium]